jgi:primosomal protein N'
LKLSVSLAYNIFEPLTYRVADAAAAPLRPGSRVLVPLGRRLALGWVVGLDSPYGGSLKNIIGIIDDPFCPDGPYLEFARRTGAAYFASSGSVLDHCLPPSQKALSNLRLEIDGQLRKITECNLQLLEKMAAAGPLRFFFKTASEPGGETALPGTGDGASSPRLLLGAEREEAYRQICEQTLERGRSVILLVPDNATARYWQTVMPGIDLYHSEIKATAKEKIWRQYRQGKSGIVCGGLSALMLPLVNLGSLIVDRATSPLYQRPFASPFRIDHLAELRAQTGGIPLLNGASGHSCATYCQRASLALTDLRRDRGISCQVHMLKGRERGIPSDLVEMIRQNHLAKKKTLVLVNRIQPVLHLFCDPCRKIAACPRCGGILQVDMEQRAACSRCSFSLQRMSACPRCGQGLTLLHDISIDSLSRAVERVCGEKACLVLTAAELKDAAPTVAAVQASPIVIATAAALSPFFKGWFAAAIFVKPESFFNMEEFNAAEMIQATGAAIEETLAAGGELHVFSVFHFHYALQFLLKEENFFERELKYRRWFVLPPFACVYELEMRDKDLRRLAAVMRELNRKFKEELQIKRVYLASRQPRHGTCRGILELHATADRIAHAGLHKIKGTSLRLTAG